MTHSGIQLGVPEDLSRLAVVENAGRGTDVDLVVQLLRQDLVVLARNVSAEQVDSVMHGITDRLSLSDALELQAGFAGFLGLRHNIGKYFMSVSERGDYQFIAPHCEGTTFIGIQLASFFCYENSTDGGATILMNVDDSSKVWPSLRERVRRGKLAGRPLARHEILRARALYQLNLPADGLRDDDRILQESPSEIPGLTVVDVLAKPEKAYSRILERKLNAYWFSIESIDLDSVREYASMLRQCGLLKEPHGGLQVHEMDPAAQGRIWHSGVDYAQLFKCKITLRLVPGDLVIQNNLTWTHAASNWSPGSGTRNIAAAFA